MSHQMLNASDRQLLSFILDLHAESGPIERNQLSVKARGVGIEVARALLNLKKQGLVEEVTRRPNAFRRFFGARTLAFVQLTEAGLAQGSSDEAPATGEEAPAPVRPNPAETAPVTPVGGPAAATPHPAPTAPKPAEETGVDTPSATTPAPDRKAQAPRPAKPRESRQALRARLDAFTEDLGGVPVEAELAPGRPEVAPDVMDGLRETLALHDLELTAAGETLIADRMAGGATQGEALCQVVLYAFAHAVHLAALGGCAFQPGALKDYAVEIMRALEALRDSGEIRDDRFEEDMRQLWALIGGDSDARQMAETLLSDPIGGMAPSAVLPDEMLVTEDIEAWPH